MAPEVGFANTELTFLKTLRPECFESAEMLWKGETHTQRDRDGKIKIIESRLNLNRRESDSKIQRVGDIVGKT